MAWIEISDKVSMVFVVNIPQIKYIWKSDGNTYYLRSGEHAKLAISKREYELIQKNINYIEE